MAVKWQSGHTNAILCLNVSSEGLVASGAEGGELSTWSEHGVQQGKTILGGGEDVTCIAYSPTCPSRLYASHGETVSMLDVRSLKVPIESFCVNEEEINCISVNDNDGLLCAADDSGAIKVIDLESKKVNRSLRKHSNICSAVAFRPGRPQSMLSCGLDMQVMLWNLQKTRPQSIVNLQQLSQGEEEEEGELEVGQKLDDGQLFNPPLAHSLSVAACGNVFGCGAEDGRIRIFRVTGPQFELELSFRGHSKGVSHVHFLPAPCWLLSGGNDGKVLLWDIGSAIAKEQPSSVRYGHRRKARRNSFSKKDERPKDVGANATDRTRMSPKLSLDHGEKVNWITSAEIKGSRMILVADQSSCISTYPLTGC